MKKAASITFSLLLSAQTLADDQQALKYYEKGLSQERAGNLEAAVELYEKAIRERSNDGMVRIPGEMETIWVETPRGMTRQQVERGGSSEVYHPNRRRDRLIAELEERWEQQQNDENRRQKFANPPRLELAVQLVDSDQSRSISGGERGKLVVTIKNTGQSAAEDITVKIKANNRNLDLDSAVTINRIEAGDSAVKAVAFSASKRLDAGEIRFIASASEKDGFDADDRIVAVQGEPFKAPELMLASQTVRPGQGNLNYLVYELINQGQGTARDVQLELETGNRVILQNEGDQVLNVGTLAPGAVHQVRIGFYTSLEQGEEVPFRVRIKEQDPENHKTSRLATVMPGRGTTASSITSIAAAPAAAPVDSIATNIPEGTLQRPMSMALVIGNRNYGSLDPVRFAHNDANLVGRYLSRAMGYSDVQVRQDMKAIEFRRTFGTREKGFRDGELFQRVELRSRRQKNPEVFIYYSGHGAPDQNDGGRAYIVPVDTGMRDLAYGGYPLNDFYDAIAALPSENVTVVIDSCFSGSSNDGMLQKDISPAALKVAKSVTPSSGATPANASIFTSTAPEQVSYWYEDARHSLFTYHFLRGLQGKADQLAEGGNEDNRVTSGELHDFLSYHVEEFTISRPSSQTPLLVGSQDRIMAQYEAK
jgi:hypothetical protein